jgi:hypothetical protein
VGALAVRHSTGPGPPRSLYPPDHCLRWMSAVLIPFVLLGQPGLPLTLTLVAGAVPDLVVLVLSLCSWNNVQVVDAALITRVRACVPALRRDAVASSRLGCLPHVRFG